MKQSLFTKDQINNIRKLHDVVIKDAVYVETGRSAAGPESAQRVARRFNLTVSTDKVNAPSSPAGFNWRNTYKGSRPDIESMIRDQYESYWASKEIAKIKDSVKDRLAPSQYAALRKLGYNENRWKNMTSEQASKIISQAKQRKEPTQKSSSSTTSAQPSKQPTTLQEAWKQSRTLNKRVLNKFPALDVIDDQDWVSPISYRGRVNNLLKQMDRYKPAKDWRGYQENEKILENLGLAWKHKFGAYEKKLGTNQNPDSLNKFFAENKIIEKLQKLKPEFQKAATYFRSSDYKKEVEDVLNSTKQQWIKANQNAKLAQKELNENDPKRIALENVSKELRQQTEKLERELGKIS